jgi:hypothetical protein
MTAYELGRETAMIGKSISKKQRKAIIENSGLEMSSLTALEFEQGWLEGCEARAEAKKPEADLAKRKAAIHEKLQDRLNEIWRRQANGRKFETMQEASIRQLYGSRMTAEEQAAHDDYEREMKELVSE